MRRELREAFDFLESHSKETVYMNSGSEESYKAGIKLVNKYLRLIKKELKK